MTSDETTGTPDEDSTAAGVPLAGAGPEAQDAHGGSIAGPDAGTTTGTPGADEVDGAAAGPLDPLDQPAAGGDSDTEAAQGDGAPDSH
jgi:hypothetical protein